MRRGQRVGDHLVRDDGTGTVRWASDVTTQWDGTVQAKKNAEGPHPQWYVQAGGDPYPVDLIRPETPVEIPTNVAPTTVGETSVSAPQGATFHLFNPGVGSMRVGFDFVVR